MNRPGFLRRGSRPARPARPVPRSRFAWRELLSECLAGVLQRPGRSALTAVGTVLGVGTFVAVLGLTATASSQIDERFNTLTATEVTVEDVSAQASEFVDQAFPPDADERVSRLNGVRHAGVYWTVRLGAGQAVRSTPVGGPAAGPGPGDLPVVAASSGALEAAAPTLSQGRVHDAWHDATKQRVAVIGSGTASRLGITTLETRPAVFIGDHGFTVIGIVEDVERKADLLLSVVVPRSTAQELWGVPKGDARMLVSTRLGAAAQIAAEAPTALSPSHPEYFKAVPPPDPRTLRANVTADLDVLFLLLASLCLFIGTIGIANTTLVAVMERTGEIGLRRALGARTRHVTAQFLAESAALGSLGGLIGTALGTITVVAVALVRDWTPVLHPGIVAAAPALGLVTGLLAGVYPAWRAGRVQPAEALRR
ncbi:ABC transporter permease [Streptomyces sp. NBC_00335]|uniref:ABC transporter permease n=1 Tax=Streptomyces sp. NBC_00335 TaxID=2975714 RepID=UPI003FA71A66